jgi:hypothetical protein
MSDDPRNRPLRQSILKFSDGLNGELIIEGGTDGPFDAHSKAHQALVLTRQLVDDQLDLLVREALGGTH